MLREASDTLVQRGGKMHGVVAVLVVALTIPLAAQEANSAGRGGMPVVVLAVLAKTVDSKKAKVGDEITARIQADVLSGDQVVLPRGAKIIGKVTAATAKSRGDGTSTLAFTFDRLETKIRTLLLTATVQAIAAPVYGDRTLPSNADGIRHDPFGPAVQEEPVPVGRTPERGMGAADSSPHAAGSEAILTPQTIGMIGITDVELSSEGETAQLTSHGKSVKLESGTRILLRISGISVSSETAR